MSKEKIILVLASLALLVVYFSLIHFHGEAQKKKQITAYSDQAQGYSHFVEFLTTKQKKELYIIKEAIFFEKDLTDTEALLISSPSRPISELEAKSIHAFVQNGGFLYLSFHNLDSFQNIKNLLDTLDMKAGTLENKEFRNGKVNSIKLFEDVKLSSGFENGQTYAFYSPLLLGTCPELTLDCYVRMQTIGYGEVLLQAGLPLFANGMIHRENNSSMVASFIDRFDRLAIDEYHHFYEKRTAKDLMTLPEFLILIFGIALSFICFLIFNPHYLHLYAKEMRQELVPSRTYHDLNINVLSSALGNKKPDEDKGEEV